MVSSENSNNKETHIAFLRGINMIGQKTMKMETLKSTFESLGLYNVKTILASGNVIFDSEKSSGLSLSEMIENKLEQKLSYKVSVVIRSINEIRELVSSKPFKRIIVSPRTKLLLTFLSEKPISKIKTPFESSEKDFKILRVSDNEVYSVVTLLPNKHTSGLMSFLEKEFGKKITTRNWNTILKCLK
ncbi:MAG TPA: DUF1697 domain-containing protein [Chitinophagaceae bacterium]|nr:DUF1697 domain-containing protein [Chitinophagaceae bacterium]